MSRTHFYDSLRPLLFYCFFFLLQLGVCCICFIVGEYMNAMTGSSSVHMNVMKRLLANRNVMTTGCTEEEPELVGEEEILTRAARDDKSSAHAARCGVKGRFRLEKISDGLVLLSCKPSPLDIRMVRAPSPSY